MNWVREERCLQSEMGIRKLHRLLKPRLEAYQIKIGRDKLFELCRKHGLLIVKKTRRCYTTNSNHGFRKHSNLLAGTQVTGPHQAWVGDITYIRIEGGRFVYLALLMDAFSRKIIGWNVGQTLEAEGCINALKMAIKQLPKGVLPPIHHTDRGIQYCCNEYNKIITKRGITLSMTEENHCYENAMAERLNKTFKYEYHLKKTCRNLAAVKAIVKQSVNLYNNRRPHVSLGYEFPSVMHQLGVAKEEVA